MKIKGLRLIIRTIIIGQILALCLFFILLSNATVFSEIKKGSPGEKTTIEMKRDTVVKEYIQSCRGQAKKEPQCQKLRNEAVPILKEDILLLGSSANKSYLTVLSKILRSDEPILRSAAADAIGMIGPTQTENPVLINILNDPVPLVRNSVRIALQGSNDPTARLLVRRADKDRRREIEPDPIPDTKRLGVPVYTNSTFIYFGSSVAEGKYAFTTSDSVSTVVKFYSAKAALPAKTKEQFTQAYSVDKGTPMAGQDQMKEITAKLTKLSGEYAQLIQKAIKEGKDIDKVPEIKKKQIEMENLQKELQKVGDESTRVEKEKHAGMTLAGEYFDDKIFGSPMFIVLEETTKSGMKRPTRFVVVFEDLALKKTGLVIHIPAGT